MATLQELTNKVREHCEDPDTTELPDAKIQSMLTNESLNWINRHNPKVDLGSFTTVADQNDYDSLPANGVLVTEVFWSGSGYDDFSPEVQEFVNSLIEYTEAYVPGLSAVNNQALIEGFYKNYEQYVQSFSGRGWFTEERKIRITPYPSSSGDTVYFFYTLPRYSAVTDITNEDDLDALRYHAASMAMRYLAIKRGKVRSSRGASYGGGQMEKEMQKEFMDEAKAILGVSSVAIGRE